MSERTDDFLAQLRALGYEPELRSNEFVLVDYEVEVGKHIGEQVKIGLQVPADWPISPPSGPFVSPRLLPLNPSNGRGRPWDAVHAAHGRGLDDPAGVWEYWSRPFTAWPRTDRSVKAYLRHLRTLFAEIKPVADKDDEAKAA
jgi:hypothetical protein